MADTKVRDVDGSPKPTYEKANVEVNSRPTPKRKGVADENYVPTTTGPTYDNATITRKEQIEDALAKDKNARVNLDADKEALKNTFPEKYPNINVGENEHDGN